MAAEEEKRTVILDFQVDQSKAVKDLERTESAILDLKKEQSDLNKEYKAGTISQAQYVRENLKLQQSLKKENDQKRVLNKLIETESNSRNALKARVSSLVKEYDNLNQSTEKGIKRAQELEKELKDLNAQINKGSKSAGIFKDQIGNYPEAFKNAASEIRIAGTSVSDLGTKLTALMNPVTAVVGVVGALGAAYARSTIGAKDLEFAQARLSAATTILTNAFASFISSAEDGQGVVSSFLDEILDRFIPAISAVSETVAQVQEEIEDIGREELEIRAGISDRLEENQELLTLIADDAVGLNEKLNATNTILANLVNNQAELVSVKQKELEATETLLAFDQQNEDLQTRVLQIKREISKTEADTEKRIQAILRTQNELNQKLAEENRIRAFLAKQGGRNSAADQAILEGQPTQSTGSDFNEQSGANIQIDSAKTINDAILRINEDFYQKDLDSKKAYNELKVEADKETTRALGIIAGEASQLFDESTGAYKILASASTLIGTYAAAQKAYESLVGIPFAGPGLAAAAAAVAVAQGLARVAAINGVQFAEGGYTGDGAKYDVAGVVHKGEYVTPKHLVESPAAKPHLAALERMRTGYADGGFVTNTNTFDANQSLMMMNAIKMLPPPVVGVREITRVQNQVNVKEAISRR